MQALDALPAMAEDPFVGEYIKTAFGSVDDLRMDIMRDFFRFAFNGDGWYCFVVLSLRMSSLPPIVH